MRIYGKPYISEKSGKTSRDHKDKTQNKKRTIDKDSPEENNHYYSQLKTEEINYNKILSKNKGHKPKQLSVNKEYYKASPNYYIDYGEKIQDSKHSSSTSKNFHDKFKRENSQNNYKNKNEKTVYSSSNNTKENKMNNNSTKKNRNAPNEEEENESMNKKKKNLYKSKSKIYDKLRNIIKKLSSLKRKKKVCFYKWVDLIFLNDRNNNDNEEYEEMDDEPEVEEEIEVEEEEEEEVVHNQLEKIEERAPDEEESTIGVIQKSSKKKYTSAKMKLILRNILRFKSVLRIYFRKWFLQSKNKKINKNKKNIKTGNKFLNQKELINLKNIIIFGKTGKRVLKKYYKIWRFITFNLEPVNPHHSSKKTRNANSNNISDNQEEYRLKKEDSSDSKKYKPKSKTNNFKLINNYTKNSYNDISEAKNIQNQPERPSRGKVKLSKRDKFLKKIIEALNDYKNISFAMSKWYFLSKKKSKHKRDKKILSQKSSHEYYDERNEIANQNNQILAQTAYLNKMNSFNSNEVVNDSDNSQKYLSNSTYIKDNRKREREREREKEKERIREKEIERIREIQREREREKEKERYREKEKEKIRLKMNKKESNENKEMKEVKAYKESKNNEMKMLHKTKELINGITPIDDVRINFDSNNNSNQFNRNNNSNEIQNIPLKEQEDMKNISLDNKLFNIKENKTFDEKIDEINKKHLNNKFQRYLLIQIPKSKKKKKLNDNFKIDSKRESFSTLNLKIKMEHLDKTLLKIIKKAYCRKNTLMNCFDKWFDITYNNKNYIPFLHENKSLSYIHPPEKASESVSVSVSLSKESAARSHKSKSKKGKKSKKVSKEILKASSNEVELDSRRNSLSSITNNIIKEHFKDNTENENSSANKSKFSDSKNKIKNKNKLKDKKEDSSQKKDKKMSTIEKDKNEETPKKKVLQIDTANSTAKKEFKKNLDFYSNINKDPKLELKALGVDIIDTEDNNNNNINNNTSNNMGKISSTSINKEIKRKRKLHHKRNKSNRSSSNNEILISSENIESIENILNDNEESTINNIESTLNLDKNKTDEIINDKINEIKTLKNNLRDKKSRHSSGSDINPDVVNIEIIQAEENLNGKKSKTIKSKKSESRQGNDDDDMDKSNNEIDKKYSKEERKLIKKYKKALHKLRAVIRSHRKRRKELNTFNPDLEAKRAFQKWVSEAFPQGLDQYRNQKMAENSDTLSNKNKIKKPKKKNKEKNELETIKLKKMKQVIKLVNKKIKMLIDKNRNEILKIYFNKWHEITTNIKQNEQKIIAKEKEKQNSEKKANKEKPKIIILNNKKETNPIDIKELNKEIKKDKIKEVNKEKIITNNVETLKYKQKEKEKELPKEKKINKELNKEKPQIRNENNEKTKAKINDAAKGIIKDIRKDKIKDTSKEIVKDNSKDIIKDKPKELIKDNNKDKIKEIDTGKAKDKSIEPKENKETSIVNKDKEKNIENKEELKPKDIKQIPNVAQQTQKNDILNTNPVKKFNRPVIDWNELSREDSFSPIEENKSKDDIKVGLTKSQVIKIEDKPKKSKTQSKNDNEENEEDFYFMKIIQRKKNNDMKKKLFDKLCTQIENNIKENFIEENKKENAESEEESDEEDENESENSYNNLEKNNLNNLLSTTEKKKRIKILKDSQSNISNNTEFINYNLENKFNSINSNKIDDEKVSSLINISSAEKDKKDIEEENEMKRKRELEELKQRQKEKELQRQKELKEKEEKEKIEKERKEKEQKEKEEKERQEKERQEKERQEKERQEKERQEKERQEKDKQEKERKENERKEREEKERKEKIGKETLEKNNKNVYQNIHIINPNQNKYDTPRKLIPNYDPYEKKTELPKAPKVQPPRQVLELERLKGKSRLPDIQRTFSFNRKKFGLGNLDVVEPGELVSNIKLRQIKDMLIRQSDPNIISKSTFKGQNEKVFDFVSSAAFSKKKYDSDNEERKVKKSQVKKILNDIITKINNKKIKTKIDKYFKKWKNPSKYIKNMPSFKGITMLDCAPPPKQERRSSVIPVVFLSKSLINETKPFLLEEEKNIESDDTNRIDKNFVNIEKINAEKKENKPINNYRKDSMPQRVKNGGRIEFVFPSQKEFSSQKKENNAIEQKNNKKNEDQEEEEEEEEEFEEEEKSEIDYKNLNNNGNNNSRRMLKFDSKSSISSKSDPTQSYNNSSNKKNGNNIINGSDNKSKEIENSNNNIIYLNESKEKYKLISPEIYKLNKAEKRTKNNILNLMSNISGTLFKNINSDIFINLSKKYIKDFGAYHIFTLYSLFNKNHEFYDKRYAFNAWKKIISRPLSKYYNYKNNFNYYDCENFGHCLGCICYRKDNKQTKIKRILIKYIFMKEYNPVKYYLYLWYKKAFIKKK